MTFMYSVGYGAGHGHGDGYGDGYGYGYGDGYGWGYGFGDGYCYGDGGDMSCTWTNAGWNNETLPEMGPLYYTMRGESIEDNAPELSKNKNEYLKLGGEYGDEEYAYLFTSAGWTCYNTRSWDDNYMKEEEIPAGPVA